MAKSEGDTLLDDAKQLVEDAQATVKKRKGHVEPTQLRIAVGRLRLFLEQHTEQPTAKPPTDNEPTDTGRGAGDSAAGSAAPEEAAPAPEATPETKPTTA